ncbi:hypothetical protein GCM10012280_15010 [Wenjunlia tyrosinilytica]|uniref:Uncharacterized protein n=1 Tax=Wenjunlia tyrosinilytica TaxID=1544741 RepID=A0A918DVG0_9ACTN|nr:hypothetical protein GCM10012280_15010 [Wenjunlia tyrosinilytica]
MSGQAPDEAVPAEAAEAAEAAGQAAVMAHPGVSLPHGLSDSMHGIAPRLTLLPPPRQRARPGRPHRRLDHRSDG